MDDIASICARLLTCGAVARRELRELEHPSVRADVEERLSRCGLALATSAYVDYIGLRLAAEVSDPTVLDSASNLGLGKDACALLTVLWARLALQRRTAEDSRTTPAAQPMLIPDDQVTAAHDFTPTVRFETLAREFGSQLGGRTRLKSLLGQLRRVGFVTYRRLDDIAAGPLLELAIDGERMVSFIRSRVLNELLQPRETSSDHAVAASEPADKVLRAISEHEGPIGIAELQDSTGMRRVQLRAALNNLRGSGRIKKVGERQHTRYELSGRETA